MKGAIYFIIAVAFWVASTGCSRKETTAYTYKYEEGVTVVVMHKFMGVIVGRKDGKYLVSYGADCGMKEDLLDERVLDER